MNPVTERRKSRLVNLVYFSAFIVLYFLFIKYAFGLIFPFLISFFIAMAIQSPIRKISKKTRISKKLLSIVFVILILLIVISLLTFVGYKLVDEFSDFGKMIVSKAENIPSMIKSLSNRLISAANHLPGAVSSAAKESIEDITNRILALTKENNEFIQVRENAAAEKSVSGTFDFSFLATPLGGLWSTAKHIPAVIVAILISIISCFFVASDYDNFTGIIKGMLSKENEEKLVKTKHIIVNVLGKYCKSYALIMFITCCEIALGLYILKLCKLYTGGYIIVIAICTALMDILPVFGTGTVMIPWAVISLFTHKIGLAIGLAILYVVIFIVRQVLEPRLVAKNVDMHPFITLASMYIGLQVFGFIGLIFLPITLVIIKTLNEEGIIHLWNVKDKE